MDLPHRTVPDPASTLNFERIKNALDISLGTYATELPTRPQDGQEIYFPADAANGILWHFRYREKATGSYKWEFLGGPPIEASDLDARGGSSATYADLPTDPITLTLPALAGDYLITAEAVISGPGGLDTGHLSYAVGATAASDNWSISQGLAVAPGSFSRQYRHAAVAASSVIAEKYRVTGGSLNASKRRLSVIPIRVG